MRLIQKVQSRDSRDWQRAPGFCPSITRGLLRLCPVVPKAMAQSVRGLRQSAALCGREELPLTVDLLQGSEAITAVLSRYAKNLHTWCS